MFTGRKSIDWELFLFGVSSAPIKNVLQLCLKILHCNDTRKNAFQTNSNTNSFFLNIITFINALCVNSKRSTHTHSHNIRCISALYGSHQAVIWKSCAHTWNAIKQRTSNALCYEEIKTYHAKVAFQIVAIVWCRKFDNFHSNRTTYRSFGSSFCFVTLSCIKLNCNFTIEVVLAIYSWYALVSFVLHRCGMRVCFKATSYPPDVFMQRLCFKVLKFRLFCYQSKTERSILPRLLFKWKCSSKYVWKPPFLTQLLEIN